MKLDNSDSSDERRRWKIVRTDDYTDVAGEIITADEITGECCLQVTNGGSSESKTMNFGPKGLKIISRRR